jgi:hypothetical protein
LPAASMSLYHAGTRRKLRSATLVPSGLHWSGTGVLIARAYQTVPSLPLLRWGVHPTLPCKPQSNEELRDENEKTVTRALQVRT